MTIRVSPEGEDWGRGGEAPASGRWMSEQCPTLEMIQPFGPVSLGTSESGKPGQEEIPEESVERPHGRITFQAHRLESRVNSPMKR
jgi:hypothetical protein